MRLSSLWKDQAWSEKTINRKMTCPSTATVLSLFTTRTKTGGSILCVPQPYSRVETVRRLFIDWSRHSTIFRNIAVPCHDKVYSNESTDTKVSVTSLNWLETAPHSVYKIVTKN